MQPLFPEVKPGQSIELLKELHILTRDGKMNQDSRRKLKQVYHLYHFIEPLLKQTIEDKNKIYLIDHGAGKSYLGFIIYDLFFKSLKVDHHLYGIETRGELIDKSKKLAAKLEFPKMSFLNISVADSIHSKELPEKIDVVTALHACDTATDDAIQFALNKQSQHIVLVPCCQAEVAAVMRQNKKGSLSEALVEVWRHPIHTREFGSHLTNVLRCLRLESYGYDVTVTELVGFEHSMKNELIVASRTKKPNQKAHDRLQELLKLFHIQELATRFQTAQSKGLSGV